METMNRLCGAMTAVALVPVGRNSMAMGTGGGAAERTGAITTSTVANVRKAGCLTSLWGRSEQAMS